MPEITPAKWPTVVATVAGGLSTALGLTVLVGWHTHNTTLLQIHPTFVAMVYNTALGFVLCGTALIAIALGRPRLATIGGLYAVIVGLLTLAEITLARDLGIDQLFMKHYVLVANPFPGRMAINTAIFFPLIGLGLLGMSLHRRHRSPPIIFGLIGSVAFAQGLVAFSGYLTGVTGTYAWGNLTRIAVHTAFGFAVLGVGFVAVAWRDHHQERKEAPHWLPIVVGVAVAAISICLWQALVIDQRLQNKQTVEDRTTLVRNEIAFRLQAHIMALERMARRWRLNGLQDPQQRKADATMIVADYKGFASIRWIDPSDHIGWTIPLEGHEAEQGTYLAFEERRTAVLEAARNSGKTSISRPIDLLAHGKGFLIIVPLREGDKIEGYINGVVRIHQLLDAVLSEEVTSGYAVVVFEGNDEIYRRGESTNQQESKLNESKELGLPGMNWRVRVWPDKQTLVQLQSSVPTGTLIAGLLMALILGWTVRMAQSARHRSKVLEITSLSLKREVDERTLAERSLASAVEKERALFSNTLDVLCSVDAEGRFVSMNPACQRLWGYLPEELLGRLYIDLVFPEDVPKTNEIATRIIKGESVIDFVNRYRHKDGSLVYTMWSSTWSVSQQLMFAVARNITEVKRAEQRLERFSMELQRSNSELQDFASVASHDLQEPLRKIQSFADELRVSLGDKLEGDNLDTLTRMVAATERMRQLINDLLAFSRIASKAKPFGAVDLQATVSEVLQDLEASIRDRGGRVDVGTLPTIDADPMQMRQLMQNLVGNGLKFHRPGIPPVIKINSENGGSSCRLSFEDNGIGFDEKYLDRIFTLFQRLHGRSEYEGTGMGLAICRKIVERHGGAITARSDPGSGATFIVTLPMKQLKKEDI